tara:strand:+ start:249 stop:512 length:264 start_codon:yes stop_codon:yes gene_type:complete
MELLNVSFALLVIKIAVCVLPGVFGVFLLTSSGEAKRQMRGRICNQLFGVSNAIPYLKFRRFLHNSGALLLLISLAATWWIHLKKFF